MIDNSPPSSSAPEPERPLFKRRKRLSLRRIRSLSSVTSEGNCSKRKLEEHVEKCTCVPRGGTGVHVPSPEPSRFLEESVEKEKVRCESRDGTSTSTSKTSDRVQSPELSRSLEESGDKGTYVSRDGTSIDGASVHVESPERSRFLEGNIEKEKVTCGSREDASTSKTDESPELFRSLEESLDLDKGTCVSHGAISVIGRRREMEDEVAEEEGFMSKGGKKYDFFGVYDGHGGTRVAHACRERLHEVIVEEVEEEDDDCVIDWEKVMMSSFRKMDDEVNRIDEAAAIMGSTVVVVVVGEEEVVVANCGDSRAVLFHDGEIIALSDDHKPDRPDELARIEDGGGKVINWNGQRVMGVLTTSRSIGDHYLNPYVTSEPEVRVMRRTEKDEFIILASDGLWDVISNELACEVVQRCLDGQLRRRCTSSSETGSSHAAALLAALAIARGSTDNISVIVIELQRVRCLS